MSGRIRIALCFFLIGTMVFGVWFQWPSSSTFHQELDASKGAGVVAELGSATAMNELKFSTLEHDFGVLRGSASFTFDFENQSRQTVKIKSITPSCSCTLIKPDKNVFTPGEKGSIIVSVDPSRQRPGRHAYSIIIAYESDSLEPTRLLLYTENKPDIDVPNQLTIRSIGDRSGKSRFAIIDYRENAFEIKKIQTSSPRLLVRSVEKPTVYLPGWRHVFEASFDGSNLAPSDSRESIQLHIADPEHPILTIPVVVHKMSRMRATPEDLHLRPSKSDKRMFFGTIYIDDREGLPVAIASVQASQEGVRCTYTRKPTARHQIEVCFDETGKQEVKFPQDIRIIIERPVREEIIVRVYCKSSFALRP